MAKNVQKGLAQKKKKKTVLGRGLDALLPEFDIDKIEKDVKSEPEKREFFMCDIDVIIPNRYQPRTRFSEEELGELSDSIIEHGIIQPLTVRESDGGYELVAGERRLRASKMAGFDQVPVVIKTITDTELLEMSIVENIQRENLNPIEEADAYGRLMDEFGLTQEEASKRVGKSRSTVANFLRLKTLPNQVREAVLEGVITFGHAKALMGAENKSQILSAFVETVAKKLSVRQTEALVNKLKTAEEPKKEPEPTSNEIYFTGLAEELSRNLGTKVAIKRKGKKGRLEIEYYSDDDLNSLIDKLKKL